jgi:putative acetyltransferase
VSIHPEYQNRGLGSELIISSMDIARNLGYRAVIIYGNPRYYGKLGFRTAERYDITTQTGKYAYCMMVYPLYEDALPVGLASFSESSLFEQFEDIDSVEFKEFDQSFPIKEKAYDTSSQNEFKILTILSYKRKDI